MDFWLLFVSVILLSFNLIFILIKKKKIPTTEHILCVKDCTIVIIEDADREEGSVREREREDVLNE